MRVLRRSQLLDLTGSPGVARLSLNDAGVEARSVSRMFKRLSAAAGDAVVIDLRLMRSPSSALWAAIVRGLRTVALDGRRVTVQVSRQLQRLVELSCLSDLAQIAYCLEPLAA